MVTYAAVVDDGDLFELAEAAKLFLEAALVGAQAEAENAQHERRLHRGLGRIKRKRRRRVSAWRHERDGRPVRHARPAGAARQRPVRTYVAALATALSARRRRAKGPCMERKKERPTRETGHEQNAVPSRRLCAPARAGLPHAPPGLTSACVPAGACATVTATGSATGSATAKGSPAHTDRKARGREGEDERRESERKRREGERKRREGESERREGEGERREGESELREGERERREG